MAKEAVLFSVSSDLSHSSHVLRENRKCRKNMNTVQSSVQPSTTAALLFLPVRCISKIRRFLYVRLQDMRRSHSLFAAMRVIAGHTGPSW